MSHLAKLGLVVAFVVAACSSTKDALFDDGGAPGGAGGSGVAGSGGGTSGSAGSLAGRGGGGAGGAFNCATAECARPYECKRSCGGPIEYSGCCACDAPLFDDFLGRACSVGGAGGRAGAAAGGRGGGAAGSGGAVAGSGGSARGGSGGSLAGSGGSAGASGSGGASTCDSLGLCARPSECVRSCGGPIEYTGCCCEVPLFDNFGDIACRDMGTPTVTYAGCADFADLDHITIAKRDIARDLCVKLMFVDPGQPPSGLSLRWSNPALSSVPAWGLQSFGAGPAAACATSGALPNPGQLISGMVTVTRDTASVLPVSVGFDLSVTYQSSSGTTKTERMNATDVATTGSCTAPLLFK